MKNSFWASRLSRLDSMTIVRGIDDMYELHIRSSLHTYPRDHSKKDAYCELTRLILWTLITHFLITSQTNFIKALARRVYTAMSIFASRLLRQNRRFSAGFWFINRWYTCYMTSIKQIYPFFFSWPFKMYKMRMFGFSLGKPRSHGYHGNLAFATSVV